MKAGASWALRAPARQSGLQGTVALGGGERRRGSETALVADYPHGQALDMQGLLAQIHLSYNFV